MSMQSSNPQITDPVLISLPSWTSKAHVNYVNLALLPGGLTCSSRVAFKNERRLALETCMEA